MSAKTKKFQQRFSELCDWFSDKGIPPSDGFVIMAAAVGAIIAQLPDDRRKDAISLAHTTINDAVLAATDAGSGAHSSTDTEK